MFSLRRLQVLGSSPRGVIPSAFAAAPQWGSELTGEEVTESWMQTDMFMSKAR